jgi:non-specific serine/threonine protein kinase/serine/threonine-protein kinase
MRGERLKRAQSIFDAVVDLTPSERAGALAEHCGDDEELRLFVEKLLASDDSNAVDLLHTPVYRTLGVAGATAPADTPETVGPYKILGVLGEGGMGIVYLAEQTEPLRRRVALKLIRFGMDTKQVLARFEAERQALAMMNHPNVAGVFDAGVTEDNRPYFVMEYVPGMAITDYCEANRLDTRARLDLFIQVCDGVQHAHQKGVIHRDLKPRNILTNERGQPKILDFGVARLTNADVTLATMQTELGQLVGTIPYMSPEQVAGVSTQVDTRSDVYALGVICYRLLTGRLPYDLTDRSIPEAARIIREEEPTRLSAIDKVLRGDLDTIITKALEKDKTRRYQSASQFAADLRNYLANRPIDARPPTTFYQLKMFTRRNRALVGGTLATILALLIGGTATLVQATRATRQRDLAIEAEKIAESRREEAEAQRAEAQRHAAIAQAVSDFLNQDLLAAARPDEMGRDVTVREVLERAATTVSDRFKDQPLVEAAVHATLGNTQITLGEYGLAELHLRRASELHRGELGEEHRYFLKSFGSLGNAYSLQGRYQEAEPILTQVLERQRRNLGEEHPDTLNASTGLAALYVKQGRYTQAESLFTRILEIRRHTLGEEHAQTLATAGSLADLYLELGRYEEAESLYTHVMGLAGRAFGDEHPVTLAANHDLAMLYQKRGRYHEAEPLLTRGLDARRRVFGEEHPRTLITANLLALLYRQQGRYDDALQLYIEVLEARRRVLGEEHPHTLNTMNSLANLYARQGALDQAEMLYADVVQARRRTLGEDHARTLSVMGNLAAVYSMQGRYGEAEVLLARVLEVQRRVLGEEHPKTLISMNNIATLKEELGLWDEARVIHLETLEIRRRVLGDHHPDTLMSLHNLGKLCGARADHEAAEILHREALRGRREALGDDNHNTLASLYELAVTLVELKKFQQAEPLAVEFHERIGDKFGPTHAQTDKARALLAGLYDGWGRPEEAKTYRTSSLGGDAD